MPQLTARSEGKRPELRPLSRSFYEPSARIVAPRLLGHLLLRQTREGICGGPIVETEAYLCDDPACHAAPGMTDRNRVMFGPAGHAYVYFIYGVHFCVNAVCRPIGTGEAVLIRAIEGTVGPSILQRNRPVSKETSLTSGPGKLCAAMQIDRSLNGADLCDEKSSLWVAENPDLGQFIRERGPLVRGVRIGITKAASLPLRFILSKSRWLSRRDVRD